MNWGYSVVGSVALDKVKLAVLKQSSWTCLVLGIAPSLLKRLLKITNQWPLTKSSSSATALVEMTPFLLLETRLSYWPRTFELVDKHWKENNLDDLGLPEHLETWKQFNDLHVDPHADMPLHLGFLINITRCLIPPTTICVNLFTPFGSIRWCYSPHLLAVQWKL